MADNKKTKAPKKKEQPIAKKTEQKPQKLTKEEKKARLEQMRASNDGKKAKKPSGGAAVAPRRNIAWTVLSLLLAFLFGILAAVGGIVGGGYYAYSTITAGQVLNVALGEKTSDYLSEQAQNKTLQTLIQELSNTQWTSLNAIDAYSPVLRNKLVELTQEGGALAEFGISLDVNTLMSTEFSALGDYISNDVMGSIEIGKLLNVNVNAEENALMLALCYGTEGVDYDIQDGKIVMKEGKTALTLKELTSESTTVLNALSLAAALGVTEKKEDNGLIVSLLYGEEGVNYQINAETNKIEDINAEDNYPLTIGTLVENPSTLTESLTVESVLDVKPTSEAAMLYLAYGKEGVNYELVEDDDGNPIEVKMREGHKKRTVLSLTEEGILEGASIRDLIGEGDSPLMTAIGDWTMDDLKDGSQIDDLEIRDIIEIDESEDSTDSKLMQTLAGYSIADLKAGNFIDDLEIRDIIEIDESEDSTDSKLMQTLAGYSIADLKVGNFIDDLEIRDIIEIDESKTSTDSKLMQTLAGWKISDLKDETQLEKLTIGDILDIDSNDSQLMQTLEDKDLAWLQKEENLQNLPLHQLISPGDEPSKLMETLCTPHENPDDDWTLGKLSKPEAIKSLTIGEVIDTEADGTSLMMKTLGKYSIGKLSESGFIESLELCEIIDPGETPSKLMQTLCTPAENEEDKWTIKRLSSEDAIKSLTLDELIEIDENSSKLMRTLRDEGWTIATLNEPGKIEELKISDIIDNSGNSKLMQTLCDNDWTIKQLCTDGEIEKLTIEDIIDTENATSKLMTAISKWQISDLKDQSKIESLKISDVLNTEGATSNLISAISDWSIGDLSNQHRIERLKIGQILDGSGSHLMQAISEWRISDLSKQEKLDSLSLGDVLEIDENDPDTPKILISLKHTPLGIFTKTIDNLTLCDIMNEADLDANKVLRHLKYCTLDTLASEMQNITLGQVFGDDIYSFTTTEHYNVTLSEALSADEKTPVTIKLASEDASGNANFITKHKIGSATVVKTYFYQNGSEYIRLDKPVYELTTIVNPVYEYQWFNYEEVEEDDVVKYEAGKLYPLTPTMQEQVEYYKNNRYDAESDVPYDDYSQYIVIEEEGAQVRYDLEPVIIGYTYAANGEEVPAGEVAKITYNHEIDEYHIHSSTTANIVSKYYDETNVKEIYGASELYDESQTTIEVTAAQEITVDENGAPLATPIAAGTAITRYLDGIWWVLLESDFEHTFDPDTTKLFDMATVFGSSSNAIDNVTLKDLYLHGIIVECPNQEIPAIFGGGTTYPANLADFTISQTVSFVNGINFSLFG